MKKLHKVALNPRGNKLHNLQKNIGSTSKKVLQKFELLAAPLEGYSETAFRTLCHKYGAHKTYAEMARVQALARNNKSTWRRISLLGEIFDSSVANIIFEDKDVPTGIQLLPGSLDHMKRFLEMWHEKGLHDHIIEWNLNLGCPSPHIVNIGLGCAMMKRISHINKHIELLRQTGLPVSVKMRLGLNEYEKKQKCYLNVINETNADSYIIHARHGRQKGADKPDWNIFEECAATAKRIIANGDVRTVEHVQYFQKIGVHGVMLGRVAVQNPSVFTLLNSMNEEHKELESNSAFDNESINKIKKEYLQLMDKYYTVDTEREMAQKYQDNFLRHFANPKYEDLVFMSG